MQRIDPMRDFRDAKAMAQTLREALKTKSVSLTHGESLELVATILGFRDWNVLSATIQSEVQPAANPGSTIPATVRLMPENQLPIVPLRDIVLFPQLNVPLFAGRAKTIHAVEHAMAKDRRILVVTQRRPDCRGPLWRRPHRKRDRCVQAERWDHQASGQNVHACDHRASGRRPVL